MKEYKENIKRTNTWQIEKIKKTKEKREENTKMQKT